MLCKSCGSPDQHSFPAELCIHFPGFENLNRPAVFAFPQLVVCMDCGFSQFSLPEADLRRLAEDAADKAAA